MKEKLTIRTFQRLLRATWNFLKNLAHEFMNKGCQKSAAALTYMTLFALVPMMTVTYSMFSLFAVFDGVAVQLQEMIFSHFVPQSGDEVQNYLSNFSSQARSLTGFGVGILIVTAYIMLTNIEKTFNNIWGVKQARRGLSSFLLYWAVLSIGPLLLGAGLIMSTYLLSLRLVVSDMDYLGVSRLLFRLIPLLMTSTAFTLLFAAVPNCRVPIKYAVFGGVTTAICFELLKAGFAAMVAHSDYKLIYGAFAAVPLFLLWINLVWTIILAGAVFVRTLAEKGYQHRSSRLTDMLATVKCLAVFRERAQTGEAVTDEDCVATGIGLVHWQYLRALLVEGRWIAVTEGGHYVLCRDLAKATLWDLACLVKMPVDEPLPGRVTLKRAEAPEYLTRYYDKLELGVNALQTEFSTVLDEFYETKA